MSFLMFTSCNKDKAYRCDCLDNRGLLKSSTTAYWPSEKEAVNNCENRSENNVEAGSSSNGKNDCHIVY